VFGVPARYFVDDAAAVAVFVVTRRRLVGR